MQRLLPLLAAGAGVVLTTSISNRLGQLDHSVYSASKAALRSMARSWARELQPRGVRVNSAGVKFAPTPAWYVCSNPDSGSVVGTMTMPMSHLQQPGPGLRPGVPLPGQHLAGASTAEFADPAAVRAQVEALLAELTAGARDPRAHADDPGMNATSAGAGTEITRRAHILEQAHEVLVQALTTVDKI